MSNPNPVISDHQPDYEHEWETQCARCGSSIEREICPDCTEDFEDGDEDGPYGPCDTCGDDGGWWRCLSSFEWCEAHPLPGRENIPRGKVEWFQVERREA